MIKITDDTDINQIVSLWQQAFGDSKDDIIFFIENCRHKSCLGFFNDDILVSMLFLVDCVCDDISSKYIYAACTQKSLQSKGYMSKLLDYCKKSFSSFCLIPAEESLINFYYKRGLTFKTSVTQLIFDENDEIKEYLFDGCSLEEPFVMKYIGG